MENLISDILATKTLHFRCFKRELKERFLDKYITNNIWGRLKFCLPSLSFLPYVAFFLSFSSYNIRDFSFFL